MLTFSVGYEDVVLTGSTDEFHANMAATDLPSVDEKPPTQHPFSGQVSKVSAYGRAEMLISLEHFPYERYGLHLTE